MVPGVRGPRTHILEKKKHERKKEEQTHGPLRGPLRGPHRARVELAAAELELSCIARSTLGATESTPST